MRGGRQALVVSDGRPASRSHLVAAMEGPILANDDKLLRWAVRQGSYAGRQGDAPHAGGAGKVSLKRATHTVPGPRSCSPPSTLQDASALQVPLH